MYPPHICREYQALKPVCAGTCVYFPLIQGGDTLDEENGNEIRCLPHTADGGRTKRHSSVIDHAETVGEELVCVSDDHKRIVVTPYHKKQGFSSSNDAAE